MSAGADERGCRAVAERSPSSAGCGRGRRPPAEETIIRFDRCVPTSTGPGRATAGADGTFPDFGADNPRKSALIGRDFGAKSGKVVQARPSADRKAVIRREMALAARLWLLGFSQLGARCSAEHETAPRFSDLGPPRCRIPARRLADQVEQFLAGVPEQFVTLGTADDELCVAVTGISGRQRCRRRVDVRCRVHGVHVP